MLILPLLLVAWAMQGAEQLPALSAPVATMTIESAKYCLGATGLGWIDKRHPVPADAVMLMLKVLVKYRNQGSVPIPDGSVHWIISGPLGRTARAVSY